MAQQQFGPWSDVQSLNTGVPNLGPVTNIKATVTPVGNTVSATISWDPTPSANGYEFQHTDSSGTLNTNPAYSLTINGQRGDDFQVAGTQVVITGLPYNAPLNFRVRAVFNY